MRYALTAILAATVGALLTVWALTPPTLADRVKKSADGAVSLRKQAMVDCMAYTAAKMFGTLHGDKATDAACESLADDFVSALPPAPPPAPAPTRSDEVSL
jgi:hypothetical protein